MARKYCGKYCGCDMFFDSGRSEPARCEFCGGVQKPEPRVQVAAQHSQGAKKMDCKKCGMPMYHPSSNKLCPKCEGERLDEYIAQQEAVQQKMHPTRESLRSKKYLQIKKVLQSPHAGNANRSASGET